jgi:hypothetical protein
LCPQRRKQKLRGEKIMAYLDQEMADPTNIMERQWAIGKNLNFSTFTSCIGIAVKCSADKLLGIHLGLYTSDDKSFSSDYAVEIANFIKLKAPGCTVITIFGCLNVWRGNQSESKSFYDILTGGLSQFSIQEEKEACDDGQYSVSINGEIIKVSKHRDTE